MDITEVLKRMPARLRVNKEKARKALELRRSRNMHVGNESLPNDEVDENISLTE